MAWKSFLNFIGICLLFTTSFLMAAPLENNDSIEPNTETIESDLDAVPAAEETTSGTAKTQTEDELELNM